MPTLPQNWGRYLATVPQEGLDTEGADAQNALAWVRQFDPNARYTTGRYSANGVNWEDTATAGSVLQYDNSLLPTNSRGQRGMMGLQNLDGLKDAQNYRGPTPWQDPTFGKVGASEFPIQQRISMVDVLGPLLVGGFMGLGAGGFSLISSLMQKAPQVFGSAFGGAPSTPNIDPQQLMLLNLLARQRGGIGGP